MTQTVDRTVLFAALRGSTALYLRLGNAQAATVVTQGLALLEQIVTHNRGKVVKKLGDGLMAVFDDPERATQTADEMHDSLERIVTDPDAIPRRTTALKLKVALARGEMVEVDNDWFGDAVNVAARLLDLAGDNETLATESLIIKLPSDQRERFRSLDRLHLRGRSEPVLAFRMEARQFGDTAASTQFEAAQTTDMPAGSTVTLVVTEANLLHRRHARVALARAHRVPRRAFPADRPQLQRHLRPQCQRGAGRHAQARHLHAARSGHDLPRRRADRPECRGRALRGAVLLRHRAAGRVSRAC